MKATTVSIVEGKRDFSRLIKEAAEMNEDIVVTRRGNPIAVIVSYQEYRHAKKLEAHHKILESREAFLKSGISASDVFKESREALEKRG